MGSEACFRALTSGELVAFPTDTFYALSCDPFDAGAVDHIRKLKGSPPGRPLPLLLPPAFDAQSLGCQISVHVRDLMAQFWPGPLTLIVPCEGPLAELVGKLPEGDVGIREPGPPAPTGLLQAWGGPLVGTSANPAGAAPACTADEVHNYFGHEVCVMAGRAPGGQASTVVRLTNDHIELLREGRIARSELILE